MRGERLQFFKFVMFILLVDLKNESKLVWPIEVQNGWLSKTMTVLKSGNCSNDDIWRDTETAGYI